MNFQVPTAFLLINALIPLFIIFLWNQHHKRPRHDEYQPQARLTGKPLMEYKIGKRNRHHDAELVNRNHHACGAVLQRLVVAEP